MHLSSFYRWKKGSIPQDRTIRQVADCLRVRESWLRDGEGPMCEAEGSRLSSVLDENEAKESADVHRLDDPSNVFRSRIPPQHQQAGRHALAAIMAKLSDSELEETIATTVTRLREESLPLMKLTYITTLKACADALERRLAEGPGD